MSDADLEHAHERACYRFAQRLKELLDESAVSWRSNDELVAMFPGLASGGVDLLRRLCFVFVSFVEAKLAEYDEKLDCGGNFFGLLAGEMMQQLYFAFLRTVPDDMSGDESALLKYVKKTAGVNCWRSVLGIPDGDEENETDVLFAIGLCWALGCPCDNRFSEKECALLRRLLCGVNTGLMDVMLSSAVSDAISSLAEEDESDPDTMSGYFADRLLSDYSVTNAYSWLYGPVKDEFLMPGTCAKDSVVIRRTDVVQKLVTGLWMCFRVARHWDAGDMANSDAEASLCFVGALQMLISKIQSLESNGGINWFFESLMLCVHYRFCPETASAESSVDYVKELSDCADRLTAECQYQGRIPTWEEYFEMESGVKRSLRSVLECGLNYYLRLLPVLMKEGKGAVADFRSDFRKCYNGIGVPCVVDMMLTAIKEARMIS